MKKKDHPNILILKVFFLKRFYPPKGDAKHMQYASDSVYLCFIPRREIRSISSRGPIEVSFNLLNFGLERVYWTSKTYMVYRVFLRENILFHGMGRMGRVGR